MLPSVLFGFLLSRRRRRQQDPEKGGAGETTQPTQEDTERNLTEEDDTRDRVDSADGDLVLDDGADSNDNEIIRQVDEEGRRRNEFGQETREGGDTREGGEEAQKPSLYRRLKAIVKREFAADRPEDITPTYRSLPIVSGILIPFSILLEIPGLTDYWYIRTENHQVVETRPNTRILDTALGFSIACAIIANLCLLVRFMEKRVKSMTWTCTVFLTIHDAINITAVIAFGVTHRFDDGFTFGQAFWMTVCSTIASTLTNVTLLFDILRTPNFATSGSGLTRKQRALVIIIILLLFYLAIGALINHVLVDLSFLNALYFTVVSIETIGFGDITPEDTGARVFICFYAVFGILNLGLAVSLTRETVLEALEVGSRIRVQRLRRRRHISQWRRHVAHRWKHAVKWRLKEKGQPLWVKDPSGGVSWRTWFRPWNVIKRKWPWLIGSERLWGYNADKREIGSDGKHPRGMCLNLDALSKTEIRAAAMETGVDLVLLLPRGYWERRFSQGKETTSDTHRTQNGAENRRSSNPDTPFTYAVMGRMIRMLGNFALSVDKSLMDAQRDRKLPSIQDNLTMDIQNLAQQYEIFRESMEREERHAFYTRFAFAWILFIIFWMVGAAIFMKTEKWTFGIAMYFCFIAFTTIGYGDLSPVTPAGRSVFIVWALLGVGAMTILISIISEAYSNRYQHIIRSGVFDHVVKRYRDQIHRASIQPKPTQLSGHLEPVPLSTAATLTPSHEALTTKTKQELSDELEETRRRTDEKLVALPHEILSQAREFHDDISYFLKPVHALPPLADQGLESDHKGPETSSRDADRVEDEAASPDNQEESQLEEERSKGRIGRRLVSRLSGRKTRQEKMKERNEGIQKGESARPIPESLDRLLNEITGVEGLSKRAKEEILEDDDARHTLLALSIQEALGRLIIVAEDALQSLAERDALMKLQERERETKETAQGQNGGEQ